VAILLKQITIDKLRFDQQPEIVDEAVFDISVWQPAVTLRPSQSPMNCGSGSRLW
jgi:hypothetical protein